MFVLSWSLQTDTCTHQTYIQGVVGGCRLINTAVKYRFVCVFYSTQSLRLIGLIAG